MTHFGFFPRILIVTITIWFFWVLSISAKVCYVDNSDTLNIKNSVTGGTESQPWCTIDYALKQIKGGDTLRIKKGTYPNQYTLNIPAALSGTKGNPTLIEGFGNGPVIIRGPGVNGGRVAISGVHWLILRKIAVTHYNQGIFVQQGSHGNLMQYISHIYSKGGLSGVFVAELAEALRYR